MKMIHCKTCQITTMRASCVSRVSEETQISNPLRARVHEDTEPVQYFSLKYKYWSTTVLQSQIKSKMRHFGFDEVLIIIKSAIYLRFRFFQAFVEAKMVLHTGMGVKLVQCQIHSVPEGNTQLVKRLLSAGRAKHKSSTNEDQPPSSHHPLNVRRAAQLGGWSPSVPCMGSILACKTSPIMVTGTTSETKHWWRELGLFGLQRQMWGFLLKTSGGDDFQIRVSASELARKWT